MVTRLTNSVLSQVTKSPRQKGWYGYGGVAAATLQGARCLAFDTVCYNEGVDKVMD